VRVRASARKESNNVFFQKKLTINFSRLIAAGFNHLFMLNHILYDDAFAGGENKFDYKFWLG